MADKTYKLNISKSYGSFSDSVQFTIPQREGTYKIEFELSNGNKVNAGNINVSSVEKTYKAEFKLSDGRTIDGGRFTTPVTASWHSITNELWSGSWTYTKAGDYSIEGFSGLVAGRPTRFTGKVTKGSTTNTFTAEATPFTSNVVTFNTPTTNGSVSLNVSSAGPLPKTKVILDLTKIEQYY